MKEVNQEFDAKMQKTIEVVMGDFASVRAGRANAAVLDKITVDYYGTATPITHGGAPQGTDQTGQKVRRKRESGHPQHPAGRHGQVQGHGEEV